MVKIHGVHYCDDIDYLISMYGSWFESDYILSLQKNDLKKLANVFTESNPSHYQFMIVETDAGDVIIDTNDNGDTLHQYTFKEFEEMVFSLISKSN